MSDIKTWKKLRAHGQRLGRAGLSKRAIALIEDFDGSYIGAMILAGRMKAIAQAAGYDDYWSEKVNHGFIEEQYALERLDRAEAKLSTDEVL